MSRAGDAAAVLLTPAALLYRAAVWARNRYYDRPGASRDAGIPVISVGNLTLGGTGKTPVTAWLARRLRDAGVLPCVVSRGYGGRAGRGPLVVSDGAGPSVPASIAGDEPCLLARALPGVPVVVGADRVAGAMAAREMGAGVVLLDDGFQHRRLARKLDLVLVDAEDPFGGGRVIPAGRLREPPSALRRADVVAATRCVLPGRLREVERGIRRLNRRAPVVAVRTVVEGFVDRDGGEAPSPRRAVAFCGIGRPRAFFDDLRAAGVEVAARRVFRDHHRYRRKDVVALRSLAAQTGATLVTTEKDMVRWVEAVSDPLRSPVLSMRIGVRVEPREPLLERALRAARGEVP